MRLVSHCVRRESGEDLRSIDDDGAICWNFFLFFIVLRQAGVKVQGSRPPALSFSLLKNMRTYSSRREEAQLIMGLRIVVLRILHLINFVA